MLDLTILNMSTHKSPLTVCKYEKIAHKFMSFSKIDLIIYYFNKSV